MIILAPRMTVDRTSRPGAYNDRRRCDCTSEGLPAVKLLDAVADQPWPVSQCATCVLDRGCIFRQDVDVGSSVAKRKIQREHGVNLREILTPERVEANISVRGWEEAVRKVGELLVATGGVKEEYVDAMIDTVNELGPYIVIAPGIAMPHARPEDGVLEPCMAILTLEPPVDFGNPDNDPVRVVIAFGGVDDKQHVDALREMAQVLSDISNVEALTRAKEASDILSVMWATPQEGGGDA